MTNTSLKGSGIRMTNAKCDLFDVALKGCNSRALHISDSTSETTVVATRCEFANGSQKFAGGALVKGRLTSATFKNCVFHDNSDDGIYVQQSTIHLHGEATAIHSNGQHGIAADLSAKVVIHLPSHHNTIYNNGGQDRETRSDGTITNVED